MRIDYAYIINLNTPNDTIREKISKVNFNTYVEALYTSIKTYQNG